MLRCSLKKRRQENQWARYWSKWLRHLRHTCFGSLRKVETLLNSFDLTSYSWELRKRYTITLLMLCLEEAEFWKFFCLGSIWLVWRKGLSRGVEKNYAYLFHVLAISQMQPIKYIHISLKYFLNMKCSYQITR